MLVHVEFDVLVDGKPVAAGQAVKGRKAGPLASDGHVNVSPKGPIGSRRPQASSRRRKPGMIVWKGRRPGRSSLGWPGSRTNSTTG